MSRLRRVAPSLWILWPLLLGSGCVTVYHPLSGLHAPVVVDPEVGNFPDLRIVVHCVPEDVLEEKAGLLCERVKTLFENQGAEVKTVTSKTRMPSEEQFIAPLPVEAKDAEAKAAEPPAEPVEGDGAAKKEKKKERARRPADLIVELRGRHLHERTDWTMWTLSWLTFTLAPGISENSFVQEVLIRDGQGTLLLDGALKGRIVRYFGLGYWVTTKLVNLIARDDDEDINDARFSELLSGDLYGQLSQMVFNANMRRRVLGAKVSSRGEGG